MEKEQGKNMESPWVILIYLFFLGGLLFGIYLCASETYHIFTWPKVQAEIISHDQNVYSMEPGGGGGTVSKAIVLEYRYNDTLYIETLPVYSFFGLPVGKKIYIHCCPENPSKMTDPTNTTIGMLIIGICMLFLVPSKRRQLDE